MPIHVDLRPTTLDEVFGNDSAKSMVKSFLDRDDPPHAYLFIGPEGTGKTTLARILGTGLGANGSDFEEHDTTHFTGVDHIREVRSNSGYMPMLGKARVFLFDECHRLSPQAQDALLKPSEEPPPHVYYILCTTEEQKLTKTLKSRCAIVRTERLDDGEMVNLLNAMMRKEVKRRKLKNGIDGKALRLIVEESVGIPRTALVVLDSVLGLPKDAVEKAVSRKMEEEQEGIALCRAMSHTTHWKKVAEVLDGLGKADPESIRRLVLAYFSKVLLSRGDEHAYRVLDAFREPFFQSGFPGLVAACYEAVCGV